MGFILILVTAIIAAVIVAVLFTANSNYLDSNINKSLDLTEKLGMKGTFSAQDRADNNKILRWKIGVYESCRIIMEEMKRLESLPVISNSENMAPPESTSTASRKL